MTVTESHARRPGALTIPRSRGAASGFLLILAGLWGALIPFVGPYFDFAYSPEQAWVWTTARGWLEVLPGIVTVVGGFLLLTSRNRASAMLGGWLAVAAGAWFVAGRVFSEMLYIGDVGVPAASTPAKTVAIELAFFTGLGALIIFLGAAAVGRMSVRSVRDARYADKIVSTPATDTLVTESREPVVDHHPSGPVPVTSPTDTRVTDPEMSRHSRPRRNWRSMFSRNRDRESALR